MACEALIPEVTRLLVRGGKGMRVVARAAPQTVAAFDLATALGQLFDVTGHLHFREDARPGEYRHIVGKQRAGPKRTGIAPGLADTSDARQVALFADAV